MDSRYYNDVWELDLAELTWRAVGPPPGAGPAPCPRSGVGLAIDGDSLLVYGGYSKEVRGGVSCTALA